MMLIDDDDDDDYTVGMQLHLHVWIQVILWLCG